MYVDSSSSAALTLVERCATVPAMAPLKFRCWDPTVQLMAADITLEFLAQQEDLAVPLLNVALTRAARDGLVLMQSTGLHDKNGKEIFEGDVVRGKEVGVVEWFQQDGAWGARVDSEAWSYLLSCNLPDKHKVIGNIYENPDLLPKAA